MQKYSNVARDQYGNIVTGVTITVYAKGTTDLSTIYSDDGVTGKANPFSNDSDGSFEFYAANGHYDVKLTKTGFTFDPSITYDALLYDPQSAGTTAASELFRGLHLRTHVDATVEDRKVILVNADEIVMDDGVRVEGWSNIEADITLTGAGGVDTGTEANAAWYEIHAIRNSLSEAKALLLHRGFSITQNPSQQTASGATAFRDAIARTKLAQSFLSPSGAKLWSVIINVSKSGSPTGQIWMTLEADVSGSPSGVALDTSQAIDITSLGATGSNNTRLLFVFKNPPMLVAATTFWLVLQGNYTINVTNYISWRNDTTGTYADGNAKSFDGSTWSALTPDFYFVCQRTNTLTPVTMPPGYNQRALIGFVRNDSSGNFERFIQLDKKVMIARTATAKSVAGTSDLLTLTSLITEVPYIPVKITGKFYPDAGTAGSSSVATAPDGIIVVAAVPIGERGVDVATNPAAVQAFYGPVSVITRYQHVYLSSTIAANFYITQWEW